MGYIKDTPNGWPSQGQQGDGTWIEYVFRSGTNQIKCCVTHPDYASYLLKRRGGNKDRLLVRIYLALGKDDKDDAAINAWLKKHSGRCWTFHEIHATYDHLLSNT
jgi:hypothetical protein